jgi:hypothetical protein
VSLFFDPVIGTFLLHAFEHVQLVFFFVPPPYALEEGMLDY